MTPCAVSAVVLLLIHDQHFSLLLHVEFIFNFAQELELLSKHLSIPRHCMFEVTPHFKIAYGS